MKQRENQQCYGIVLGQHPAEMLAAVDRPDFEKLEIAFLVACKNCQNELACKQLLARLVQKAPPKGAFNQAISILSMRVDSLQSALQFITKHGNYQAAKYLATAIHEGQVARLFSFLMEGFEGQPLEQRGNIIRAVSLMVLGGKALPQVIVKELLLRCSEFRPEHIVEHNFGPIKERTDMGKAMRLDSLYAIDRLASQYDPAALANKLLHQLQVDPEPENKLKRLKIVKNLELSGPEIEQQLMRVLDYRSKEGLLFQFVGKSESPDHRLANLSLSILRKASTNLSASSDLRQFFRAASKVLPTYK